MLSPYPYWTEMEDDGMKLFIGLDAVLMETRQVKGALKAMPIKTDRRDAEGIARLLHLGCFARSTVNPSQRRKPVRFSALERLSSRT